MSLVEFRVFAMTHFKIQKNRVSNPKGLGKIKAALKCDITIFPLIPKEEKYITDHVVALRFPTSEQVTHFLLTYT